MQFIQSHIEQTVSSAKRSMKEMSPLENGYEIGRERSRLKLWIIRCWKGGFPSSLLLQSEIYIIEWMGTSLLHPSGRIREPEGGFPL
jgi:hypothetical protein